MVLERCRAAWGQTSYPELIAEANASEPFRSPTTFNDVLFANESLALRYRQVWIIFALFLLTR